MRTTQEGIEATGFDVKPSVLIHLLSEGHDQVIWFDTDMVVTGDLTARMRQIPAHHFVATEEYFWGHHQGTARRTIGLGLPVGRTLKATINTGLLRVEREHVPLLENWRDTLQSSDYRAARQSGSARPIHFLTDQEALTGLLGATQWADIHVTQLGRGRDIAQCFGPSGFTVKERLRAGASLPLIVHAMGEKPWEQEPYIGAGPLTRVRSAVTAVHLDVTPYVAVAAEYRALLDEAADWLEPKTLLGAALTSAFPRRAAWRELPLTLVDSAQRGVRRRLGLWQLPAIG